MGTQSNCKASGPETTFQKFQFEIKNPSNYLKIIPRMIKGI